jgi:hypothetical protein
MQYMDQEQVWTFPRWEIEKRPALGMVIYVLHIHIYHLFFEQMYTSSCYYFTIQLLQCSQCAFGWYGLPCVSILIKALFFLSQDTFNKIPLTDKTFTLFPVWNWLIWFTMCWCYNIFFVFGLPRYNLPDAVHGSWTSLDTSSEVGRGRTCPWDGDLCSSSY